MTGPTPNDEFSRLMQQPEMHEMQQTDGEALGYMLNIMPPFALAADRAYKEATAPLEGYSAAEAVRSQALQIQMAQAAQNIRNAVAADQAERFETLIDDEPGTLGALNIVCRAVSPFHATSYDTEVMANMPYHNIAIGVPNPGDLLDLIEAEEKPML